MSDGAVDRRHILGAAGAVAASLLIATDASAQSSPNVPTTEPAGTPPALPAETKPAVDAAAPLAPVTRNGPPFARTASEEREWANVKAALQAPQIGLDVALPQAAQQIERGFSFSTAVQDESLSPLHIEPLIDQAADLFDRAIRDRATWDDLATKAFNLALELNEYIETDVIHQEEEAGGVYDVPAIQSQQQYGAESLNEAYQKYNKHLAENVLNSEFSNAKWNEIYNAARRAAWLTGLVPYTWKDQTFTGYVQHTYGAVTDTVAHLAMSAAESQASQNLTTQYYNWLLQKEVFDTLAEVSSRLAAGLKARADWDQKNAGFMRRRTLVARKYQDIKAKAAAAADGFLNYTKRLPSLRDRFQQDFRDAVARMRTIAEGLRLVYDYNDPIPTNENDISYFDDALLWIRRAIQFLIRFGRQDQSFVVPVSLKRQLREGKFEDAFKAGAWDVNITEDLFKGMAHLRLRGVSIVVREGHNDERIWRIGVRVPKNGMVRHLSDATVMLDQSRVPECQLGRVTRRTAAREPDIAGISSLHNCSPIGQWHVRVIDALPSWKHWSELEDIELDLHVAFRNIETASLQKAHFRAAQKSRVK
jgi:hypothetical protein